MANGCSLDLKIAPSCSGTHTSLKREVSAGNSPTNLKYNLCMSIVCAPLGIRGIIRNPFCRCGGIAIQWSLWLPVQARPPRMVVRDISLCILPCPFNNMFSSLVQSNCGVCNWIRRQFCMPVEVYCLARIRVARATGEFTGALILGSVVYKEHAIVVADGRWLCVSPNWFTNWQNCS